MRRHPLPLLVGVLATLLGFSACDGGIDGGSTENDTTTTVINPGPTVESRIVLVVDTLGKTATTTTIVKRKLLIKGSDTSALSLDTLTFIGSESLLDTALEGREPCTDGLSIFNNYGTEITLELWAGRSLEYSNGNILGSSVRQAAASASLLADSAHSRWCTGWKGATSFEYDDNGYNRENDLLLVVGVPIDKGGPSYLLTQGHFPEVTTSSILVIDEVGRLRMLR